ncbi:MAG TPA: hypothetical protein PLK02_04530 [Paludibacteraceae bacterium]|nr:hypothetical protein [Paludibacteraceae bacterium]HPL94350.1 hypothetical protein [Paludibacteraceae bacterium]
MQVDIKNPTYIPNKIKSLYEYLVSVEESLTWYYYGLCVEIDPIFDFNGDDALIRWVDINEGFNDKLIVHSLEQFKDNFKLTNA